MRPLLAASLSVLLAAPAAADPRAKSPRPDAAAAAAAAADYKAAVEEFKGIIAQAAAAGVKAEALPFVRVHPDNNRRSILLIHGLTDSPYYMKDVAQVFHSKGYNVVAVLLPGHGTKREALHKVKADQWRATVKQGLDLARRMGGETSIGGFSTGGALALEAARLYFPVAKNPTWEYGDVYLFSPAIDLPFGSRTVLKGLCALSGDAWVPGEKPDTPQKYGRMSANGGCQLVKIIESNEAGKAALTKALQGHGVFVLQSMADKTVSPVATENLVGALPSGVSGTFDPYAKEEGVAHADVMLEGTNSRFGQTKALLAEFIERCTVGNVENAKMRDLNLLKP